MQSRSGFSVTAPTGVQFRVFPDQRAGLKVACRCIQRMSRDENGLVLAGMALRRADITNVTVPMLDVVQIDESYRLTDLWVFSSAGATDFAG